MGCTFLFYHLFHHMERCGILDPCNEIHVFALHYGVIYYGERAFSFCGPKLWNDLPSSIKQATSADIFKKELKTFLFNKDVNF